MQLFATIVAKPFCLHQNPFARRSLQFDYDALGCGEGIASGHESGAAILKQKI
jgi:hypothetical protein